MRKVHYFVSRQSSTDSYLLFVVNDGFVNDFKRRVGRVRKNFIIWNNRSFDVRHIDLRLVPPDSFFRIVVIDSSKSFSSTWVVGSLVSLYLE